MNEDFSGLSPLNFFQISLKCNYIHGNNLKKNRDYFLAHTTSLYKNKSFADIYLGWNEEGVVAFIHVKSEFKEVHFPDISSGDSIELFIDTRDVKTSGYNTRFCHHFFFLPERISGHQSGELTKFRTDDSHPLCDPQLLQVQTNIGLKDYTMNIFIPSDCLFGYDPAQFRKIGFNYRINRADGTSQFLSAIDEEFKIEEQPSLWSSLNLVK